MVSPRDISFRSAGLDLAGRLFEPDGAARASGILFVHGLRSNQGGYRERAEAAVERLGAVCLTFDLGGHGQSGGSLAGLSARTHLVDLLAAYDYLGSQPSVDGARIGVCGASYGAYLTALLTSERPSRRLLLRAPALYADQDLDTPFERRGAARDGGPSVALERLARYDGDVLIVESALDEVISAATIDAYRTACRRVAHEVIPDTGHELVGSARARFRELIVSWFAGL
jgi:dienelactone hydrolase